MRATRKRQLTDGNVAAALRDAAPPRARPPPCDLLDDEAAVDHGQEGEENEYGRAWSHARYAATALDAEMGREAGSYQS